MSLPMFELTVPVFIRGVTNLKTVLTKARAFCEEKKIDDSVLLNARLSPTMFPLLRQVQVTCDQAKNTPAHLAGVEPEVFADTETTFGELLTRVDNTLAALEGFSAEQLEGSDTKPVSFAIGPYKMSFLTGQAYVQNFAVPNFYFHLTAAYAILRHNGVDLGKGDYLGGDMGAEVTLA